jgi:ABC-2 type transport system permease protein
VQATMLPLFFISGVWFTTDFLPDWLRAIAEVFPIEHLAAALHQAIAHGSFSAAFAPADLALVAVWAAAGIVVAARRFTWLPSPARA